MNWTYWNWNQNSRTCAGVWNSWLFQLNIEKALTCCSKYFKLKEVVLLSLATGWPWFILSLELQMGIWAEWWAGLVVETAKLFNFYFPAPDCFFDADVGTLYVLCIQFTLMYIHVYEITFSNCLTWTAFWLRATLSHRDFWFHWAIIFQRCLIECGGKKKKSSTLVICHEPDGLCEMARNYSKIIFSFLCLKSTPHQIAQTAVPLGSWGISWKLHRIKLSWPCHINITMYFSSHALQADIQEEIGMGRYILALLQGTTIHCAECLQAGRHTQLYGWNLPDPQILLLMSIFENQRRWWPF